MINFRELLLGPSYFYHKKLIKISKQWNSNEIDRYLKQKKYLKKKSSILTKQDYINNSSDYENQLLRPLTQKVETGGTTGTPFSFYRDRLFTRQKERAYIFDIWNSVGYKPFDLRVVFRGNFNDKLISYNYLENAYCISSNKLTSDSKEELIAFLKKLPHFFLHVYPSSLYTLLDYLGNSFSDLKIKGVLAGSESFPKEKLKEFESQYHIKVAHWYGHSEYAVLAKYCHGCDGFHFYPTYGLAEFIPKNDGIFDIIATSYNRIGTKFLRYHTEDQALISNKRCKNSNFPRIDTIIGRSGEFFWDKENQKKAFGPYLFGIHSDFWTKIKNIQFIQETKGKLTILLTKQVIENAIEIEDYLIKRFSNTEITIKYCEIIPKTKSGKHRYFINKINN